MITLQTLTLRRGANVLLKQVNWTIYHKQRIGVIGENGCGKTSLFSLLLGKLQADEGILEIPKQLKFAEVAQETQASESTALQYALEGDSEYQQLQNQLIIAEQQHDGAKMAAIHEKLSIIDGYSAPSRAAQLLAGLGFNHKEQQKRVKEFSGGWRVRLNLAQALMCRSDILLLDEPTNHLDLDAVLWLEQWLIKYPGTLLMISHDRDFLDKTVDHIVHIKQQSLKSYAGNYSDFEKLRANELLVQQATFEKQQKHLAHLQRFVERFRAKASKARQAQSRLKAIERMDIVCAVQTESPFQFHFKTPEQSPNPLLQIDKGCIGYDQSNILERINFSISPKDRIAILGPNGAGKSSFIKVLAGELLLKGGIREASPGLKIGYFAQHQVDHLQLNDTPLMHLQRLAKNSSEVELRTFLGSFGFTHTRVFEPISHFSGGEKSRLALALLVWQKPNLLLLDEPTNHLDLEMRNALSLALQEYEGAMILVSHDRFLVRTTTDQLLLAANGKIAQFDGDLNDYQRWLLDFRKQALPLEVSDKNELSKKELRQQEAKVRELRRPLLDKIKRLETELDKLQKEVSKLDEILADATLYEGNKKVELQDYLLKQAKVKKDLIRIEDEWLHACEERDGL